MGECTHQAKRPYVIGLTGNIATGKTMVAQMLSTWGAQHIDADRLAHKVMARGTPAWERIIAEFGMDILKPNGAIDRGKLGARVFSDARALARLENIVHPDVIAYTRQLIAATTAPVVVVEAIKLLESGMVEQLCDRVWVVIAPRQVRIRRLTEQRGLDHGEAVLRVDAQSPQEEKVARADVVIDNSGTVRDTKRQVERAWLGIPSVKHAHAMPIQ
jgi:dephospho-CoA kinase